MTTEMTTLLARVDGVAEPIEPATILDPATPSAARRVADQRRRAQRAARQSAVVLRVRIVDPAIRSLLANEPGECHDELATAGLL